MQRYVCVYTFQLNLRICSNRIRAYSLTSIYICIGGRCIGETENSEEHDRGNDVEEEEEEEEEDEEDEEEDEEDDQEMLPIIEKRATVFARWPNDNKWESVGLGNLAIHYDSEIYAERIVLKLDDSEEYASNTIISMDTVMRVIIVFTYSRYTEFVFLVLILITHTRASFSFMLNLILNLKYLY